MMNIRCVKLTLAMRPSRAQRSKVRTSVLSSGATRSVMAVPYRGAPAITSLVNTLAPWGRVRE